MDPGSICILLQHSVDAGRRHGAPLAQDKFLAVRRGPDLKVAAQCRASLKVQGDFPVLVPLAPDSDFSLALRQLDILQLQ